MKQTQLQCVVRLMMAFGIVGCTAEITTDSQSLPLEAFYDRDNGQLIVMSRHDDAWLPENLWVVANDGALGQPLGELALEDGLQAFAVPNDLPAELELRAGSVDGPTIDLLAVASQSGATLYDGEAVGSQSFAATKSGSVDGGTKGSCRHWRIAYYQGQRCVGWYDSCTGAQGIAYCIGGSGGGTSRAQ